MMNKKLYKLYACMGYIRQQMNSVFNVLEAEGQASALSDGQIVVTGSEHSQYTVVSIYQNCVSRLIQEKSYCSTHF